MTRPLHAIALHCALLLVVHAAGADDLPVLPDKIDGVAPDQLLGRHLLDKADEALRRRREAYEKLKTPEDVAAYQE